jgi:hypothetical protein
LEFSVPSGPTRRLAAAALAAATAAAVVPALVAGSASAAPSATTVVVDNANRQGFTQQAYDCTDDYTTAQQRFVVGPHPAPLGDGSYEFATGTNENQTELLRTPRYGGTRLAELQKLEYSTFAASGSGGAIKQPPYFRLSVDKDADGDYDESLFYIPSHNGAVVQDEWQTWDIDAGTFNIGDGSGPATTLAAYVGANNDAELINNPFTPADNPSDFGAVAIIVGCAGSEQTESTFNTDKLVVGTTDGQTTTFNFEPNKETRVVNAANQQGFAAQAYDCTDDFLAPSQAFVNGPGTPPRGAGSRQFTMGPDGNQTELYRTTTYDGEQLADVQRLGYSTYVDTAGKQPPYFRMTLSDGHSLFFFPGNNPGQQAVAEDVWQTWNVAEGQLSVDSDGGPVTTLADYAAAHPGVTLVNNNYVGSGHPDSEFGAVGIVVGCGGDTQNNGTFNADAVIVGLTDGPVTTYDFEPTAAPGGGGGGGGAAASPSASASASPSTSASPSASATATASTSPSASASPSCKIVTTTINTKTVNATGLASVTVSGTTPGATVELQGYSQNHYGTANFTNDPTNPDRTGVANASGSVTFSDLRPGSNTRLRARQVGCSYGNSDVINVRTQLSLQVTRVGARTYRFDVDSIPARPGGLIVSIYRITGSPCAAGVEPRNCPGEVFVGQTRVSATNGAGRVTLSFGPDYPAREQFVLKTGQDAQNAPGRSNVRDLAIF